MGGWFRQFSWVFHLLMLMACSYFLAQITGAYLGKRLEVQKAVAVMEPKVVPSSTREIKGIDAYQVILDRNLFDSSTPATDETTSEVAEESSGETQVPPGEAVLTSLDVKVLGVLVVGDGRDARSSATVSSSQASQGKGTGVYAVGDDESFAPNTKLVRIAPDRIEFLNNGRLEYAEVGLKFGESIFAPPKHSDVASAQPKKESSKAAASSADGIRTEAPGKYVIDQKEVDNALQNIDKLYTDIRAVPNFAGGKVSGMKILSVRSGSVFAKLGLQRGDVLQRINGFELDVKQGFQIFGQLRDAKNLTMDLIRQGQPQTFEYEIR